MPDTTAEKLDFATVAVAHKIVSRDDVDTALAILEQERLAGKELRQIEDILLERGMIKAEEVWAVYKASERLARDAKTRGERIGGYEILGKLGEGGLGVVYKARQLSMGRIVALKLLHEKWVHDDEFRKRFLVEARLVGRLSHQNLIQVFDVGRHKKTFYYSMEFIDGETIEDRIERDGRMDLPEAVDIMFQITRALQYLATNKIVHRDVKPGNIMLTRTGVAKLGDFGFVKSSLDSILSTDGEVLGTPDYISPEAAMGEKDLDFRSDLYSLGATLYHMLSGQPPFGGSGSSVMEAHIKDTAPALCTLSPDVSDRTVRIVETLMAKDRNDRYASYAELFEELEMLRLETTEGVDLTGRFRRGQVDELLVRERVMGRRIRTLKYILIAQGVGLAALAAAVLWLALGSR